MSVKRARIAGAVLLMVATGVVSAPPARAAVLAATCGMTAGAGDTVNFTADLTCSGNGIVVNGDGVKINLDTHTLTGDGTTGTGIFGDGVDKVQIRGPGRVTGFETGIELSAGSDNAKVHDIQSTDNVAHGFYLDGEKNQIHHSTAFRNGGVGIIANGAKAQVKENVAQANDSGIDVFGEKTQVKQNDVFSNTFDGIFVSGGDKVGVIENWVASNGGNGIYAAGAVTMIKFLGNTVEDNTAKGMVAVAGDLPTVKANGNLCDDNNGGNAFDQADPDRLCNQVGP